MVPMTRIIVTTGPESCGKTTLADALGKHWQCPVMPEISRQYLNDKALQNPLFRYQREDLLEIARQHHARERALLDTRPARLVLDTDLLVILVWHRVRFAGADTGLLENLLTEALQAGSRTYLLCRPDLPWEADPLRENPHDREQLYQVYRTTLDSLGAAYVEVEGQGEDRLQSALTLMGPD
jgi:nicotinamide riboside kinase